MADAVPGVAGAAGPGGTAETIRALFDRQRDHQWTARRSLASERVEKLRRLKRAIVGHREEILDAMHADFRKNRSEAELSEIQLVMTELNEAIAQTKAWMRPVHVPTPAHMMGTKSRIHYEPRGVVLIMAAWNYPFALLFAPLVGAVAAGNCVILRPSEKVPHTAAVAQRIITAAFAPDEVAMVTGDQAAARTLLELPFDHVFFTGSTPVGGQIMAAAARHLSSVTLELGGKSPAIVDETADVAHAARAIMWGKFVNAGQTCVAPDYVLVHESRAAEFFEAARQVLSSFYGSTDDARRSSEDYCRIIDDATWLRLTALLEASLAAGARLEAGGQTDRRDRYIAPTILSAVTAQSPLMRDEIFGPVLPVLTWRSRDEVVQHLHDRPNPLAMYLFSRDERRVEEMIGRTSAGGTVVNNCLIHLVNPALPFGGAGASGFGRYHGRFGFETFSNARAVVVQRRPDLTRFIYPPYARLKHGWLGTVLTLARRLRD